MIVSPTNMSASLIAPSVNIQTEQAARDNKVREPVMPAVELVKSNSERGVKSDDKRRKSSSWDPSEHPEYDVLIEDDAPVPYQEERDSELDRLFELLALSSYSKGQGKGYAMRFRLPKRIIDEAIAAGSMARRRTVIKYHYGHAVSPNTPSEVLAVL